MATKTAAALNTINDIHKSRDEKIAEIIVNSPS